MVPPCHTIPAYHTYYGIIFCRSYSTPHAIVSSSQDGVVFGGERVMWFGGTFLRRTPYSVGSSELAPKTNRGQRHHRGGLSSTPLQSPAGKINHRRSFDSFFSVFEVVLSPEKLAKGKRTACLSLNVGEAGTRGAPIIITCAITSQCHTPRASLPRNIVRL